MAGRCVLLFIGSGRPGFMSLYLVKLFMNKRSNLPARYIGYQEKYRSTIALYLRDPFKGQKLVRYKYTDRMHALEVNTVNYAYKIERFV